MAEIGDDGDQADTWSRYYESPLTVTTSNILHIHSAEQDSSHNQYTIYKDEPMDSPSVGGTLELKLTNGGHDGAVGAEHVNAIFLQGGIDGVKREPEDLTRKCISPANNRIILCDKRRLVPSSSSSHSGSPPALISTQQHLKDELACAIKAEGTVGVVERAAARGAPAAGHPQHTIVIQAPPGSLEPGDKMSGYISTFAAAAGSPQQGYETVQYLAQSPQSYATSTSPAIPRSSSVYPPATDQYYREYYSLTADQYAGIRQEYNATDVAFDRYPRPAASYRTILTVDSSPDSGISSDTKEQVVALPQQTFTYEDLNASSLLTTDIKPVTFPASPGPARCSPGVSPSLGASRGWHDFSRHADTDKIQIPKIHSDDDKVYIEKVESTYGFKYYFESPISTSPRKEDDRITYINKGQFYAITMEYIPDPERLRKPGMVKSVIMLLFREEKSSEDERKSWQFWHSRQHSVKQRILDIDTKNSVAIAGCVEEIAHNAIAVYWNPMDSSSKVNIAVQCLSTDFSSQKGVKGLPLHIQIDTYEDIRESNPVSHRGYCQIKVFCDKGAERKTRDEERRSQKRRLNPSTRKKYEDLYHGSADRSEFYAMADLISEPVLFRPSEEMDKVYMGNMDIQGSFYTHETDNSACGQSMDTTMDGTSPLSPQHLPSPAPSLRASLATNSSPGPMVATHVPTSACSPPPSNVSAGGENISFTTLAPLQPTVSPKLTSIRFHNSISQQYGDFHKDITQSINNGNQNIDNNNMEEIFTHPHKRTRLTPPPNERIMIFVRRENETIYTPLHLAPPATIALFCAIEQKYQIPRTSISNIYRVNKSGIRARVDDDMLKYYCNEESFLIEIHHREQDTFDVTLTELNTHDQ